MGFAGTSGAGEKLLNILGDWVDWVSGRLTDVVGCTGTGAPVEDAGGCVVSAGFETDWKELPEKVGAAAGPLVVGGNENGLGDFAAAPEADKGNWGVGGVTVMAGEEPPSACAGFGSGI